MPFPLPDLDAGVVALAFREADAALFFFFEDVGIHRNTQAAIITSPKKALFVLFWGRTLSSLGRPGREGTR